MDDRSTQIGLSKRGSTHDFKQQLEDLERGSDHKTMAVAVSQGDIHEEFKSNMVGTPNNRVKGRLQSPMIPDN